MNSPEILEIQRIMIFSCFPSETKCEWSELRSFVVECLAPSPEKTYRSIVCLDVVNRNEKEPELLLETYGETPNIVIERKSIVWPPMHLSDHQNEHQLWKCVHDLIANQFDDYLYQLTVWEDSLAGKKAREVRELAKKIAQVILANQIAAKSPNGTGNQEPIPWQFRPLSPNERDETMPETGFGIYVKGESVGMMSETPADINQRVQELKAGYVESLKETLEDAAEKFEKYNDCLKLLLVQFFGKGSLLLSDQDIVEIIASADLPELIDQVWLAQQEWVSLHDYRIAWKHVR